MDEGFNERRRDRMARYLITGVAGFIGSTLARELVARGETVRGIDNLSTGSLSNLRGVVDDIEFLHADLRNQAAVELACKNVDYIFHFAAIDSVQQSIDDPIGTSSINLDCTLQLIEAAQSNQVKRLVFASSWAVYGEQTSFPMGEDAAPNPLSPYAVQKLSCEQYLTNAWTISGMETVSLRFFNVFGPRQTCQTPQCGIIAQFCDRMLSSNQDGPIIYGEGEQARDFVFISDVVNASLLAMHAPAETVSGKSFNVGSGRASTVRLVFEAIACMIGYTGEPRYVAARPQDVQRTVASLEAAREAFGYKPAISLADGLYKTVTWFRERQAFHPAKPMVERRKAVRALLPTVEPVALENGERPVVAAAPEKQAERHIDATMFAEAVRNNELELFYQPILDLAKGRVVAVEALLRWRCGNRLLTPAHFIGLAEEKGLTPLIGAWVLKSACNQLVNFQRDFRPNLRLAVNISPLQLEQTNLLRIVDSALARTGLAHSCLDLEVTERTLVRDCARTQHNLMQLRRRGVRISIDDFGTGYSNMNYLYRFPIDCIKIDQSFVQHKGHARVLHGIVAFAKTLGVRTVAEGVESAHQLGHVRAAGCDEAQGFHIGRPVPPNYLMQSVRDYEADLNATGELEESYPALSAGAMLGEQAKAEAE
jgi:UDP-glucose 4-epimerase